MKLIERRRSNAESKMKNDRNILKKYFDVLYRKLGSQNWWPGETQFEIIIGAILTQNTNWKNVEKAISNLKKYALLSPSALRIININILAELVKPSGYFRIKAKRLKNFINWLYSEYNGSVEKMFAETPDVLREKLLSIKGIGPETADSILLYAGGVPTFVVDAYTYRIFSRHNLISEESTYDEIKEFFENNLPREVKLYNEYHALIVKVGKEFCRRKPLCEKCPLSEFLPG